MKQYLLSVYQPDGAAAAARGPGARSCATSARCDEEMRAAGAWVFAGGPAPAEHGHRACGSKGGEVLIDRRPVRRGQGAPRRLHDHQGARPGRRAGLGPQAGPGDHACRSRCGRSRTSRGLSARVPACRRRGDRAGLPRGVRPRGGRPGPRLRRHRHRRGGGPGRVRRGAAALAVDRAAAEPGRLDHHHRPQPGDRPAAPRGVPRRPARPGRAAARPRRTAGGGRRARRPAAPDLHLLPPGARPPAPRSR